MFSNKIIYVTRSGSVTLLFPEVSLSLISLKGDIDYTLYTMYINALKMLSLEALTSPCSQDVDH